MSIADPLIQQGRAEGRVEGRVETLLRLLQKRFGPVPTAFAERIASGTLVDLDRWTDRILDAKSVADVFAD
jgi:hypothetical protein